jgi:hypothetical protein
MAYTKEDVQRFIADVGVEKAKRQALATETYPGPAIVSPKYPGSDETVVKAQTDEQLAAIETHKAEKEFPPLEWEVTQFGLALDAYDPISGKIYVVCRPEKDGQAQVFPTVKAFTDTLAAARKPVLDERRAKALAAGRGVVSEADLRARHKTEDAALVEKHKAEVTAFDTNPSASAGSKAELEARHKTELDAMAKRHTDELEAARVAKVAADKAAAEKAAADKSAGGKPVPMPPPNPKVWPAPLPA